MAKIAEKELPPARYEYGGDEFVVVELDQDMSFEANFKAMGITRGLAEKELPGIVDICPSNASYLIRLDPDELKPDDLIEELKSIEADLADPVDLRFPCRVVDVPVMFEDPWTHETLMKFRDRHQDPDGTDLEYAAELNGYDTKDDFLAALHGSPYYVTMVGFVPGLPWCFQMVPPAETIEVPKYVRPRTETPERAFGYGGGFAVIYPVFGAGGYQLFGLAPAPIFNLAQDLEDFADSVVFARPGDIFKYRPIDRDEFDAVRKQVEDKSFRYRLVDDFEFEPSAFFDDPHKYNEQMLSKLYG